MSTSHHIFADVDSNGRAKWRQPDRVKKIFYSFRNKAIELEIAELVGKKSLPQLRYYRGVTLQYVHIAIVALGNQEWSKDDVHEEMLRRFAPKKDLVDGRDGEIISSAPIRTRNMTWEQMSKFIDDVGQWAAEFLNIAIPPPPEEERESWL